MGARTGRDALFEVLTSEGAHHIFGNPGTTELPLMDALVSRPELSYVLALQEATAVAMADGYAQVTGRPAFVNLHTSAGLGNAIGNLTNAQANQTPLVVTAGQQDRRHIVADPLLAGDLVGLARPVSKWAHEIRTLGELGTIMRRAFHDAATPPAGPVFVSLPMDILDEEGDAPVPAPSHLERAPAATALADLAAALLAHPGATAIVVGDEVATSGGTIALVAVAERLGTPVFTAPLHATNAFPPTHALFAGSLPGRADGVRAALTPFRTVLLVGGRAFMAYPYSPGSPIPDGTRLLHLSPDASQLGRTWPTDLGLWGDPRATLEALLPHLPASGPDLAPAAAIRAAAIERLEQTALGRYDQVPLHPMAAAHAMLRALPPETLVVDEAITTGTYVRGFHHASRPGRYLFCKGGGLGWGMPAAAGAALALDGEPVLCVVGDGSAMYSPQALWTAAHLHLPVVFAVVNNGQYLILKEALRRAGGEVTRTGRFVGMDINEPAIDFVSLAASMGVPATRIERAGDLGDAVRAAIAAGGPHLLDVPISAPD
jgi:benzoylformate decarboxylase